MLSEKRDLRRLRSNVAITGDDDEVARGDRRHPVRIERPGRYLRDQRVSGVDHVSSSDRERLAETKGALIDEEPELIRYGRQRGYAAARPVISS